MKHPALQYIIHFLLGENIPEELVSTIGYTSNRKHFDQYSAVIIPSGFFANHCYGTAASMPQLPLQEIEGVPLLFGSPKIEMEGDTLVIHADLIASTYFLITRYEELIQRSKRDEHGRFPGKESLPYRAGFIHRPIVDEYRILLRKWLQQSGLRVPEVKKQVQKVWLTHDVDAPTLYRSWKGVIRSIRDKRGFLYSLKAKFGAVEDDPYYTFPWLFDRNNALRHALGKAYCQSIIFLRSGGNSKQDKPHYCLQSKDIRHLLKEAKKNKVLIGLHSSYQAGCKPKRIKKELEKLERLTGERVRMNRHHFLNSREPEDMTQLEAAGITDDFTMGYADVAGFRLGTSYPVRWINPMTRRLSSIVLHPLTIMDCTLEEKKYMGLNEEEATVYCSNLIEQVTNVGGELTLLWHNTSVQVNTDSYLRHLYSYLLKEIEKG